MTPGRELPPTSAFAGDDGAADPALAAALAAVAADGAALLPGVVTALASARVLVPVVAEVEVAGTSGGLTVDKVASAGVVALRTPDGRAGLPVFTSTASMAAWRPAARPVPAEGPRAAMAALQEGWEVIVVDPAGPVPVLVPRPAVRALAAGIPWCPAVAGGHVRPEVADAVARALAEVPEIRSVTAEPGRRAEVAVVLGLPPGLGRADLDGVVAHAGAALAADETVTAGVDSLELRVVTAR